MNNSAIEQAVADWVTEEAEGLTVHTGITAAEIDPESQAVIVALVDVRSVVGPLKLGALHIMVTTPYHTETLSEHREACDELSTLFEAGADLSDLSALTEAGASVAVAGCWLKSVTDASENGRWETTIEVTLGLSRMG
jgi:hypothetical protein